MSHKSNSKQDEITLRDVCFFIKRNWIIVAKFSIIGLTAGLAVALITPGKYQASALIEPATVAKKERLDKERSDAIITKVTVESVSILAEKMKQPRYYGSSTLQVCGLDKYSNPAEKLITLLKPTVARNSNYVAVSFRAPTPILAEECLGSVLKDVVNNQARLAEPVINNFQVELNIAEQELQAAIVERDQQRLMNREKLVVIKAKLDAANKFVEKLDESNLPFKIGDPQFSAAALLMSTLISKQREIKDLELQRNALEMEIAANMTNKDQGVRRLSINFNELKNALLPPTTKSASFAAPIYVSEEKVEPKWSLLAIIGLFSGFFVGLMLVLARKLYEAS